MREATDGVVYVLEASSFVNIEADLAQSLIKGVVSL
jgi:hypothetical protein